MGRTGVAALLACAVLARPARADVTPRGWTSDGTFVFTGEDSDGVTETALGLDGHTETWLVRVKQTRMECVSPEGSKERLDPDCVATQDAREAQVGKDTQAFAQWLAKHPVAPVVNDCSKVMSEHIESPPGCTFTFSGKDQAFVVNAACKADEPVHLKLEAFGDDPKRAHTVEAAWKGIGHTIRTFFARDCQRVAWLVGVSDVKVMAGVPRIDLLDAGASGGVAALADALGKAGFAVAHLGKASSPHAATEVFFAPGFQADALAVAKALGAPESAVKPLTWSAPYAITVAAAK